MIDLIVGAVMIIVGRRRSKIVGVNVDNDLPIPSGVFMDEQQATNDNCAQQAEKRSRNKKTYVT